MPTTRLAPRTPRGYLLTGADMEWFQRHYVLPDSDLTDPVAAADIAASLREILQAAPVAG